MRAGIKPGDLLLSINGEKVADVFDYRFLCDDVNLDIQLLDSLGNVKNVTIHKKDEFTDIGLTFANPMMCSDRTCANKCIFCFIDQMPRGMRDTLYFKDDDMCLSFLTGSYVTLTNMSRNELKRIAKYHMSPINVSIHTMNPELRKTMLNHEGAGDIEEKIKFLLENNITVNGQIVLCPDVNDKKELQFTLDRLLKMPEGFESCSIVPVGVTKYREGLYNMRTFTKEEAIETIKLIEDYQKMAKILKGTNLFYASDEFYLKAEQPLPNFDDYDGFPQLENGVGMIRLLEEEVDSFLVEARNDRKFIHRLRKLKNKKLMVSIATGELAGDEIEKLTFKIEAFVKEFEVNLNVKVFKIENKFFGPEITVAGLLTGKDIINQLKDRVLGDRLLLTTNMFKSDADVFLDDVTLEELEKELNIKSLRTEKNGEAFVKAVLFGSN